MNRTNTKTFDPTQFSLSNPYRYTIGEQYSILTRFKNGNPVFIWQTNATQPYWDTLNPDIEIQFNFLDNIYSTMVPTQASIPLENIPARRNQFDIQVFPSNHVCHKRIVYDTDACEYYDRSVDIFLSDDDIAFYGLKPYSQITTPLPTPLPENYWDKEPEGIKQ